MFLKKPNHRIFDYQPRFYNPNKDVDEKRKRRLKFRSTFKSNRRKRSPLVFVLLLLIVVYFVMKFAKLI